MIHRIKIYFLVIPFVLFTACSESSKKWNSYSYKNEELSKPKPMFTFIWDDVRTSDEIVWRIFQEYSMIPSYALQTNNLNRNNLPFYKNVHEQGASILSHSISHKSNEIEISHSLDILKGYGFNVHGWVTPSSVLDSSLVKYVSQYYDYGFSSQPPKQGNLKIEGFDQAESTVKLRRIGLETWNKNVKDQKPLKSLINYAIENNLLIVFYGHQLPSTYSNDDGSSVFTESDLREILAYLKLKQDSSLCRVLSCDEAIIQYYNLMESN